MNLIKNKVLEFYQNMPFNSRDNIYRGVNELTENNQIKFIYTDLHNWIQTKRLKTLLEAGCGSGWFSITAAKHYDIDVLGIDMNPVAIDEALKKEALIQSHANFQIQDIFKMNVTRKFDIIVSLGVLHHTENPFRAIEILSEYLSDAKHACMYIGLYHLYGRKPFLNFYREKKECGFNEEQLYELFADSFRKIKDQRQLRSWFLDQVMHPFETQHSLKEVYGWMNEIGFEIISTSINKYKKIRNIEDLFEIEKEYEKVSYERNYCKREYFPGFFSVMARRK